MSDTLPEQAPERRFGNAALDWAPLPYMDEYLHNLEVDGRADSYVRMAKVGLAHFAAFATGEGLRHPGEVTRAHLLRYQAELNGRDLSLAYRQQLMKYLRGWFNWLDEIGYIDPSPWVRIKIGRVAKKPRPLEDDEVLALFDAHRTQAFSIPPFFFHRREIVLALLYGWGLRIHELAALNVAELDMRLDWVIVRNKGGGTKTLPYGDALKQVVGRWLRVRATHAEVGEDALLIDQRGHRLSIAMIRKIITELGARAGVALNPHRLRDTFGTTLLDHDVEVERIMKMMGHTQRAQTLAYARVNDHKVAESHTRVMGTLLDRLLSETSPRRSS